VIDSTARELIHSLAERQGLASCSIGSKNKRVAVFHANLFVLAQERHRKKLAKKQAIPEEKRK